MQKESRAQAFWGLHLLPPSFYALAVYDRSFFLTGYYLGIFRNNKLLFVAIQDKFEKIPINLI